MKINGKAKEKFQKVSLALDALTSAYEFMLLLFFVPYCVKHDMIIVNVLLPFVVLVPLAVVPPVYTLIHRSSPLLFGRYHLIMPLSAFLSALAFVTVFGASGGGAIDVLLTYGALAAFCVFSLTYKYCSFSVATRLGRVDRRLSAAFFVLGAAAAVIVTMGFYFYDPDTMYLNSAYIIGALLVIAALLQYFATVSETPRLGGKTAVTVKSAFRTFYTDINVKAFLSASLYAAAFFALAALGVFLSSLSGGYALFISSAALVIAFFVTRALSTRFAVRTKVVFSVCAALLIVGGGIMCLSMFAGGAWYLVSVGAYGAMIGAGGALCPFFSVKTAPIKQGVSSGVMYLLIRLCALVAASIAAVEVTTAVTLALSFSNYTWFVFPISLAAVSVVVGAVLSIKTGKSDRLPELSDGASEEFVQNE